METATQESQVDQIPESNVGKGGPGAQPDPVGDEVPASKAESEDAVLDSMFDGDGNAKEEEDSTRETPKDNPKAEPKAKESAKPDAGVNDANVDKAYSAARRSGMSKAVADKMLAADPQAFVEYGLTLAKNQSKTDDEFRRLREERKAKETAPDQPERSTAAKPEPNADPDTDLDEAIAPLAESFGDDIKEPMKRALKAARDPYRKAVEEARKESLEARRQAADAREAMELFIARDQLARTDYPDLANDETYEKVLAKAREIVDPSRHKSPRHVLEEAAAIELARPNKQAWQAEIARKHAARSIASPTIPSQRGPGAGRKLTQDEIDDITIDAINAGEDPDEAVNRAARI